MLNPLKIAVLDDYQDYVRRLKCFSLLEDHPIKVFTNSAKGVGQLAIRLAPYDVLVLIGERTQISRPLLSRLPNLKLIAQIGTTTRHIDMAAVNARGIVVTTSEDDPASAAELAWALILSARRKVAQYTELLQEGLWQTASLHPEDNTPGVTLQGKVLGIWGYGRIGQRVAGYGRAFGMHVMIWGSEASRNLAAQHGYASAESRESLFSRSDVLSLHLRLSDSTCGCIGTSDFAAMKPSALFVNTSHAALIAPGALQSALEQGRPGMAALDVFDNEPLPADAALLRMKNVLITPHVGFVTQDNYENQFKKAFRSIVDFADKRSAAEE